MKRRLRVGAGLLAALLLAACTATRAPESGSTGPTVYGTVGVSVSRGETH
ncbi:hypothetical protein EV699_12241 [Plasticicumulans lactativorans]|uniref:Lipoprotein n=1 Tax=Plasticicumulans lactativorans TaxID=1133106 RepID=A0A4R2KY39_9GAMM|nr:hypothetical protein [Plasticicumulans lactativorans]TCO78873.1 hypothetical protein EV699_12241 [Plasticicumulans lactativorans]